MDKAILALAIGSVIAALTGVFILIAECKESLPNKPNIVTLQYFKDQSGICYAEYASSIATVPCDKVGL